MDSQNHQILDNQHRNINYVTIVKVINDVLREQRFTFQITVIPK